MEMKNKKDILLYLIAFLICAIGVFLRLKAYFASYSFWMDECSLAINIIKRGIFGFFAPLEHYQSAPPLFLSLTKILTLIFGNDEKVYRFIPLVCSIASIPLFYLCSRKFLSNKITLIFALLLFNLNYQLIYFSIEFKQYSSDVFFCLLAFLIFSNMKIAKFSNLKIFVYGLISAFSLLFCLPSAFLIFAFLLNEFFIEKTKIKSLLIFSFPFFIIVPFYYFYNLLPSKNIMMSRYSELWSAGFIDSFLDFILIFRENVFFFFNSKMALGFLLLLGFGFYFLIKQKKNLLIPFFFSIVLFASIFHIYPLKQRVALYILPFLILVLLIPVDKLLIKNKLKSMAAILLMIFLIMPTFDLYKNGIYEQIQNKKSYANKMFSVLKDNFNQNDILIYNDASASIYEFYCAYYGFSADKFIRVSLFQYSREYYLNLLNYLKKDKTFWFYYPADYVAKPVIPFIKEWARNQKVQEYSFAKGYLVKIKVIE